VTSIIAVTAGSGTIHVQWHHSSSSVSQATAPGLGPIMNAADTSSAAMDVAITN